MQLKLPHAVNGTGSAVVADDGATDSGSGRRPEVRPVTRPTTVLIALSEAEEADFLPSEMKARLDAMPVRQIAIRWNGTDTGSLVAKLREHRPDVLLCAWAFPPLPGDLEIGGPAGLRYVAYLAGSVRKLVPRSLLERGLLVTNWGNTISGTVAECGLLLTLMAMRRASHWAVSMHRDGGWKDGMRTVTQSLFGRSVGIHGFGHIAQQMVPLLRPFGGRIAAYSPSVPDTLLAEHGVERSGSLEDLFSGSDVIIELAAYSPKNHHIVTEKLLRSIRPGGVLVNIGRGAVVDQAALVRVARERTDDLQVALDVYETEPLPKDSPLRGLPNVALLPHIAGPTKDRRRDSTALALDNLEKFVRGEEIPGLITPEIYDRST